MLLRNVWYLGRTNEQLERGRRNPFTWEEAFGREVGAKPGPWPRMDAWDPSRGLCQWRGQRGALGFLLPH